MTPTSSGYAGFVILLGPILILFFGTILSFFWRSQRKILGMLLIVVGSLELAGYSILFSVASANGGPFPLSIPIFYLAIEIGTIDSGIISLSKSRAIF